MQTKEAATLKRLLPKLDMQEADRQEVMDFLEAPAYGNEYVPQSQEIVGILKQLLDDMKAAERMGVDAETAAIASFKLLIKAKMDEIAAITAQIEAKQKLMGRPR